MIIAEGAGGWEVGGLDVAGKRLGCTNLSRSAPQLYVGPDGSKEFLENTHLTTQTCLPVTASPDPWGSNTDFTVRDRFPSPIRKHSCCSGLQEVSEQDANAVAERLRRVPNSCKPNIGRACRTGASRGSNLGWESASSPRR